MAEFQHMNGEKLTSPCIAVVGGNLHLKVVPKSSEPLPAITVTPTTIAKIVHVNALKGPHFTMFQIQPLMEGKATLQGTGGHPSKTIAGPITIVVEARIVLPPPTSKEGMLARLFLAETPSPDMVTKEMAPYYTKLNLVIAMSWMRVVLENRLAKPSGEWGSAGAKNLFDVVKAPGQFKGFPGYPALPGDIQGNIDGAVHLANESDDRRRASYKTFVEAALEVATMGKVTDPSPRGLYWWRTKGSGSPGDGVKVFGDKLGNTFYTR